MGHVVVVNVAASGGDGGVHAEHLGRRPYLLGEIGLALQPTPGEKSGILQDRRVGGLPGNREDS